MAVKKLVSKKTVTDDGIGETTEMTGRQKHHRYLYLAHSLVQGKSAKQIEEESKGDWNRRRINHAMKNSVLQRILKEEQARYYDMIRNRYVSVMQKGIDTLSTLLDKDMKTQLEALKILFRAQQPMNNFNVMIDASETADESKCLQAGKTEVKKTSGNDPEDAEVSKPDSKIIEVPSQKQGNGKE